MCKAKVERMKPRTKSKTIKQHNQTNIINSVIIIKEGNTEVTMGTAALDQGEGTKATTNSPQQPVTSKVILGEKATEAEGVVSTVQIEGEITTTQ